MTTIPKRTMENPGAALSSQLLTAPQVMEMLSVSRVKLHYMMRNDGLPYIKLGEGRKSAVRFSPKSLATWLTQNERHSNASEGLIL